MSDSQPLRRQSAVLAFLRENSRLLIGSVAFATAAFLMHELARSLGLGL